MAGAYSEEAESNFFTTVPFRGKAYKTLASKWEVCVVCGQKTATSVYFFEACGVGLCISTFKEL
jgi:hypothetical protein